MSKMTTGKIDDTVENWESGQLGTDPNFVAEASDDLSSIDAAVGLRPISIRMDMKQIDELRLFAEMEGIGYQPLIRKIVSRWLEAEKRMYLKYRNDATERERQEALDLREGEDAREQKRA